MNNQIPHITSLDPSVDAGVMSMLEGMGQFASGIKMLYGRCVEEKEQLRGQVETTKIEPSNVVADGMQNEMIAIINAIYARGMVNCSKKELMQRMADALGCPKIADYSGQLHKIKLTNKYEEIFDDLQKAAIQERDKND